MRETQGDAPAIRLAHRVLKALWEEETRPGDRDDAGRADRASAGLDAQAVMRARRRAALGGDAGRPTPQAALARGVFGAPSYVIGDDIFWGQDRLEFVGKRLGRMVA